jgi:hypothetical protein
MDYAAAKLARSYKAALIAIGTLAAVITVCELCRAATIIRGEAQQIAQDGITVTDPMGCEWRISGAEKLLEPLLRQAERMNKIEAAENHQRWPSMPIEPERY